MPDYLIVQRGPEIGKRIAIKDGTTTLGRSNDNDIELNDPYVSRYHSVIKKQGDEYMLIDLGSENPVQIRDNSLEPGQSYTLVHRDVIRIGQYVFSYQSEAGMKERAQEAASSQTEPPAAIVPPDNDAGATQVFSSSDRQALLTGYKEQAAQPVEPVAAPPPLALYPATPQNQNAAWLENSPDATMKNAAYQASQAAAPVASHDEPKLTPANTASPASEMPVEPLAAPYNYTPANPIYEYNSAPVEPAKPAPVEPPYNPYGYQNQPNQNQYSQPTPGYNQYNQSPPAPENYNQNPATGAANQSTPSSNVDQFDQNQTAIGPGTYGYTPAGQPQPASPLPAKEEPVDYGDAPTVIGTNYAELIRQYKEQAQSAQQAANGPAATPPAQPEAGSSYASQPTTYSPVTAAYVPEEDSAATMMGGVNYAELLRNTPAPFPVPSVDVPDSESTMIDGNFNPKLPLTPADQNRPATPNYGAYGQNYNSYTSPGAPSPNYSEEAETHHSNASQTPINQPPVQPTSNQYGYPPANQPPAYDPNQYPAPQYGQYNQPAGQPPVAPVDYNQYGQQQQQPNYNQYGQPNYDQYGQPVPPNYNQYGQPNYNQYGQQQPPNYNQYGQQQPPAYDQYGQPVPPPPAPPAPEAYKDPKDKPVEPEGDAPTAVIRIDKTKP